ncbi:MAG: hypothetical protein NT060_04530 [Candidatus Omnitrophica bacterium]|nr:hypothetical protein [Candidatus Omnitrophota bacterium]
MINFQGAKRIGFRLDKLLGALAVISVFCLIFIMNHMAIFDLDIWLHLKSGELILQNRAVPLHDIFSFTLPAQPWVDHEPLFQLLSYIIYNFVHAEGLILFSCYILFFAFFILFLVARKKIKNYFEIALLLFLAMSATTSRFNIRPDLISVLFFALFLYLLRFYPNKKIIWLLIPAQALWVNFHGYFFLGPLLILIFRRSSRQGWLLFVASLAACLINPNGLRGALYPAFVLKEALTGRANIFFEYIQELRPTFGPHSYSWNYFYWLVFLCFALLLVNFRKVKLADAVLAGVFLIFALTQRNIMFFVFVAFTVIVIYGAPILNSFEKRIKGREAWRGAAYYLVRNALAVIFIFWVWVRIDSISTGSYYDFDSAKFVSQHMGINEKRYPKKAVEFILDNNIQANIFNDFNSGAYLIGKVYPRKKVFIDGRTEFYGPDFFKEYMLAMKGDLSSFKAIEKKYDIGAALFTDTATDFPVLAKALYTDPQWRLVFFDEAAAVFLKEGDANKGLIDKYGINLNKYSVRPADLGPLGIRHIYPLPYIKRAKFLGLLREDAAAESEAREALRIMPDCAEAFHVLGRAALRKGMAQDAFENLRKGALLMPQNVEILTDLGESLIALKEYKPAERTLLRVNKLNKKYAPAYYQLSCLYAATNRAQEAQKFLTEAKHYNSQDVELSQRIAQKEKEPKR